MKWFMEKAVEIARTFLKEEKIIILEAPVGAGHI